MASPNPAKLATAAAEANPVYTPEMETADRASHQSDIDRMREHFAKQRKERIKVKKEMGEQFVQVNGYSFRIQPGVYVEVPQQIAEMLRDSDII